jgi:hypothetical protein
LSADAVPVILQLLWVLKTADHSYGDIDGYFKISVMAGPARENRQNKGGQDDGQNSGIYSNHYGANVEKPGPGRTRKN